jgi:hypothetical protein
MTKEKKFRKKRPDLFLLLGQKKQEHHVHWDKFFNHGLFIELVVVGCPTDRMDTYTVIRFYNCCGLVWWRWRIFDEKILVFLSCIFFRRGKKLWHKLNYLELMQTLPSRRSQRGADEFCYLVEWCDVCNFDEELFLDALERSYFYWVISLLWNIQEVCNGMYHCCKFGVPLKFIIFSKERKDNRRNHSKVKE